MSDYLRHDAARNHGRRGVDLLGFVPLLAIVRIGALTFSIFCRLDPIAGLGAKGRIPRHRHCIGGVAMSIPAGAA